MNDEELKYLDALRLAIEKIGSGQICDAIQTDSQNIDPGLKKLGDAVNTLLEQNCEARSFILSLSAGKLDAEPPRNNLLISPYKELHAALRHLWWQVNAIADGDYNQQVVFMGSFSEAFSKLTSSLREKKRIQDALKESERLFRTIFETSPDGMCITDLEGNIIWASQKSVDIFGYSDPSEVVNRSIYGFIVSGYREKARRLIDEMIKGFSNGFAEYKVLRKDGIEFWNESNAEAIYNAEGEPKGMFIVIRDCTERKNAEAQLVKFACDLQALNATKDKLFSIISHDLRGPLATLNMLLETVLDYDTAISTERLKEILTGIRSTSASNYNLLENLLTWAASQRNKIEYHPGHHNLGKLIDENIHLLSGTAHIKKINMQYQHQDDVTAYIDIDMIRTVIRNLLSNAIKFTNVGGNIIVHTSVQDILVEVAVSDNGVGIPADALPKIFSFSQTYTTKGTADEKGSGLGLVLCQEMIEKNGGKISVESEEGKGTTFRFTLPRFEM